MLFLGHRGEITVTDEDLVSRHSHSPDEAVETVDSFVFNRSAAAFVPRRSSLKDGAVIVSLQKAAESVTLRIAGVDSSGVAVLGNVALPANLVSIRKPSVSRDF